ADDQIVGAVASRATWHGGRGRLHQRRWALIGVLAFRLGFAEGVLEGFAEGRDGLGAHQFLAVDEEGGGAGDARAPAFLEVGPDGVAELPVVEARREWPRRQAEPRGEREEIGAGEGGGRGEQEIVVGPELSVLTRAAGGLRRRLCPRVGREREV